MDENQYLAELADKPLTTRITGYFRLSGPGYMQSAMTLGAGSMASCVVLSSKVIVIVNAISIVSADPVAPAT